MIKKCKYSKCKHDTIEIDIEKEPFTIKGNLYYHKDCFEKKQKEDNTKMEIKKDLFNFRKIWFAKISKTADFWLLRQILKSYIKNGVSSDYLLFVLKYCLDHKYKLEYPDDFKRYIYVQEIKDAYNKYLMKEAGISESEIAITRAN